VVACFLAGHAGFTRVGPDEVMLPAPREAGAATLTDGFYYACLRKGGESS
jgi:hypothetical protein